MKQTLIKLSDTHYIIVDDSEIKEDCYALHEGPLGEREVVTANGQCKLDRKITHSTQPIEQYEHPAGGYDVGYSNIKQLSLSEVKELLGEVDVEKKANDYGESIGNKNGTASFDWKRGYNQALEDNKDRKYTEQDIRFAYMQGYNRGKDSNPNHMEAYIKHLQPKTSWEVEFIDDKLKLK